MLETRLLQPTGARRHDLPRERNSAPQLAAVAAGSLALDGSIERHLGECRRFHQPLGLLSMIIDGVISADDGPAPASALVEAAMLEFGQRLRSRVRGTDHVLWQGDREYVVTLPDTRVDGTLTAQRRLAQHLSGAYRVGTELLIVSLSIGCAWYPAIGDTGAQLLAAAKAARDGCGAARGPQR